MSRRMYSKNQLENIVEDKLKGYDRAIPTELKSEGDELYLAHDGEELTPQERVHLKQLFGKYSLFGEGNIDLYIHHLKFTFGGNTEIYVTYPSTSNIPVDSVQDLNTLFRIGNKYIQASGLYEDSEAQRGYAISAIAWYGTFAKSGICYYDQDANVNEATFVALNLTNVTIEDAVQTL